MSPAVPRRRAFHLLLVAVSALTLIATTTPAATAASSGMFAAGQRWTGEFADPSILRVGNTYYAYSTTTGGDNLPVAVSTDLKHWTARAAYPADANPGWWAGYNDALPHPAEWALYDVVRNGRSFTRSWAPSVAKVGSTYVLAYSLPISKSNPNRRCLSIATSRSPLGQFVDRTAGPLVCSSDPNGSNDPQIFTVGSKAYLIWKNTGRPGSAPTRIWSRQLDRAGTGFAKGSAQHQLLATAQKWEGNLIEGPAMIAYRHRYYLFYSANRYLTSAYAVGYAICTSPLGGCRRPQNAPLIHTGGSIAGPGGPTPVIGPSGGLRLGYAAWDKGHVGYTGDNHRRLHVATLGVGRNGTLQLQHAG